VNQRLVLKRSKKQLCALSSFWPKRRRRQTPKGQKRSNLRSLRASSSSRSMQKKTKTMMPR
jgi:hypothetical protein